LKTAGQWGQRDKMCLLDFFRKRKTYQKKENLPPILTFFYKKSKKVKIKNQQNQKIIKKGQNRW